MICIGLTGRVGSGKSTVAQIFKSYGVPIIHADQINQMLLQPGQAAYEAIKAHFGERILLPNQSLNKRMLRQLMVQHAEVKHWLETLLHPLIQAEIKAAIKKLTDHAYCIIEIPLLIHRKDYSYLNRMLVIDSSPEQQLSHVITRDQVSAADAQGLIDIQASRAAYLAIADDVVLNDSSLDALEEKIKALHLKYTSL
jgi:dephospho-CoA kinase